jgi:hypothetical protein
MSKSNTEAFPYPVLTNEEDSDFKESFFHSDISLESSESEERGEKDLEIKYELKLENKEISKLIERGEADFAFLLKSQSTGYREIFFTGKSTKGKLSIPLNEVYGRLEIEAQVIIIAENVLFTSEDLNDEFRLEKNEAPQFKLTRGDPIAFSDSVVKVITFEPLTLQSLIRVNLDTGLDSDVYSIDTSSNDYLTINMGGNFKGKWDDADSRKHLISGVIKDAILFSLNEYIVNREDVEAKKWASLIIEKFKDIEEDISSYRDDLDKLNQKALEIASRYTIGKMVEAEGE